MADIIKKVNALGLLDQYTIAKSLGQEDEFCKSHGIDIEKARGEGSKGGKIVGHTKSGKPIYDHGYNPKYDESYSHADHSDISEHHAKVSQKLISHYGKETVASKEHKEWSDAHKQFSTEKSLDIDIEKGGKAAAIGEIREFGGKKYQKQSNGWRPVKKGDQKSEGKKEEINEDLVNKKKQLEGDVDAAETKLKDFTDNKREAGGLVPDSVRKTEEYKNLKQEFDSAFKQLRDFNSKNKDIRSKPSYKESSSTLDLSKHSKQELLDAKLARAKSGVSESDPEMKQLQAELDKRGEEKKEEFKPGQKIKTATWGEGTIVSGKVEEINGYPMVEIRVKNRSKGEPGSGHGDFHNVKVHIKGIEPQSTSPTSPSSTTHIGDMSKEQKFAAAAKFGIANPEKLSSKELDKQLTDKNIEAELKKFKESKGSDKKETKAGKESSWRDNLKVGDEFSSGGRRGRIVELTDNPNYVKIDEGFLGIKTISKEVLHPTKDSDHISEKYKEKYSQK